MFNIVRRSLIFLISYLHIQLFITLISLPILIYWGLPFSIASPVGNLIFTPFLTIFLLLSSVIFFCEIVNIPNILIITCLEYVTHAWIWLCNLGMRSWLIALAQPSLIFICAIPVIALTIVHYKKLQNRNYSCAALLYLLLLLLGLLTIAKNNAWKKINMSYYAGNLELLTVKQTHVLIDSGILGSSIAAPSHIEYNLIPALTKLGIGHLDYILCARPSLMTFKALVLLCRKLVIKKIFLPAWHGKLSNSEWQAWEDLLANCKKYQTDLVLIKDYRYEIIFSDGFKITLSSGKNIKKNNFYFTQLQVTCG